MGGKITDLAELKKQTVQLDILRSLGKDIVEEGATTIAYLRDGTRIEQGWLYIVLF